MFLIFSFTHTVAGTETAGMPHNSFVFSPGCVFHVGVVVRFAARGLRTHNGACCEWHSYGMLELEP